MTDQLARRYGQRPSALLGIDDPYAAFDFDMAVMLKAERLECGVPVDDQTRRDKWATGYETLAGLQQQVLNYYDRRNGSRGG